jgi:hypothetical protein
VGDEKGSGLPAGRQGFQDSRSQLFFHHEFIGASGIPSTSNLCFVFPKRLTQIPEPWIP